LDREGRLVSFCPVQSSVVCGVYLENCFSCTVDTIENSGLCLLCKEGFYFSEGKCLEVVQVGCEGLCSSCVIKEGIQLACISCQPNSTLLSSIDFSNKVS
jgi:hypothetical protein